MKRINVSILILISLFMLSCSGRNVYVNPDYSEAKFSGAALLITKMTDIKIYQDENDFNPTELDSIKNLYLDIFNKNISSIINKNPNFETVGQYEFAKLPEMESAKFELKGGESIKVNVPKNKISFARENNIYVLFLQDGFLHIKKRERDTSDPAKHFTVDATPAGDISIRNAKFFNHEFIFNVKYFIYDNVKEKVVVCGNKISKQPFRPLESIENLMIEIINDFAEGVLENSPFK